MADGRLQPPWGSQSGRDHGALQHQRSSSLGSGLARLGPQVVQLRFRLGSGLARFGLKVVQLLFRFGSDLARLGSNVFQLRFRFGSGLVHIGSKVVQRFGADLVPGLVRRWFSFGSDLVQVRHGLIQI